MSAYRGRMLEGSPGLDEREHDWGRCYTPSRPTRTAVLVHGVTGRGSRDPALVQLARSLARHQIRSVIPELTHLAQFAHHPEDVATVVRSVGFAAEAARGPVVMLGFSYGGAYALRAAADPSVAEGCRALVTFGAYHDLDGVLEHQRRLLAEHPDLRHDDADLLYLRATLLRASSEWVSLSTRAWREIDAVLRDFTSPGDLEQKRRPLLEHARHLDYAELMSRYQTTKFAPELSPRGALSTIRASVGLLHDPKDRLVPQSQAKALENELRRSPRCPRVRVLATPMLSHVEIHPLDRLRDLPALVLLLRELFV